MLSYILLMNEQIASAIEEQSVTLSDVSKQVDIASDNSQRSSESFSTLQNSSSELRNIVAIYEPLIRKFNV